jgi:hypothetical protein
MDGNLQAQYDQVITYFLEYRVFADRLINRYGKSLKDELFVEYVEMVSTIIALDPLINKNPSTNRQRIAKVATESEKQNEYFDIVISDYFLDSLASHILARFPEFDFGKLKKLHDLKKEQFTRFNAAQIVGAVLAVATLLLKSVPESVVSRVIEYSTFELYVFLATIGLTLYLFVFILPLWLKISSAQKKQRVIGDILSYITIKQGEKKG